MKSKKSDRNLKNKIKRLEKLIDASLALSSTLNIDDLLNLILQKAEDVMEAEASSVFKIDREKNDLYFLTARGTKAKEIKKIRIPLGKGIVGWVAKHGKPVLVADVKKDQRWFNVVDKKSKFTTRSILAVPLFVRGKVVGVAEVLNKRRNRHFDRDDMEMFVSLGNQIAIAVENASLYRELDELFLSSIRAIVEAVDAKDEYTRGHSARVVEYSLLIGRESKMNRQAIKDLEISAILHDVGKIGIPDRILGKPGKLNFEEFAYMKNHPRFGAEIIEPIAELRRLSSNILHHHERFDGHGYPGGLSGTAIPLYSRIIAVADSFDAMTSDRPYRSRLTAATALVEIEKNAGSQFDPEITKIFIAAYGKAS